VLLKLVFEFQNPAAILSGRSLLIPLFATEGFGLAELKSVNTKREASISHTIRNLGAKALSMAFALTPPMGMKVRSSAY
jgi:hypothetical protein